MKNLFRPVYLFNLIVVSSCLVQFGYGNPQMGSKANLPKNPRASDFSKIPGLAHPLIPFGRIPTTAENRAFASVLETSLATPSPDAATSLEEFVQDQPNSPWSLAILSNLAPTYRKSGQWSQALKAWEQVWKMGQHSTDPEISQMVDSALVGYATLIARLGRTDELRAFIESAGGRVVRGSNAEKWEGVKVSLFLMKKEPEKSYRCGPLALGRILAASRPEDARVQEVHESISTTKGTSLLANRDLAQKWDMNFQVAKRELGATIIFPAVVHWKLGHFAAVIKPLGKGYLVQDPTFTDDFCINSATFDEEGSGYFLVPNGPLPTGWRSVSDEEAATVWGKGTSNPEDNQTRVEDRKLCKDCPIPGMAAYNIEPSRVDLNIFDTPLFYDPPRGPSIRFSLNYSQRDTADNTQLPSAGNQWNCNWASKLQNDPDNLAITILAPGGGQQSFSNYTSTGTNTGYFARDIRNRSILRRLSTSAFELEEANGAKYLYDYATLDLLGAVSTVYLTKYTDPQGNTITYHWAGTKPRLTYIEDAIEQQTTLTYVTDDPADSEYYKIAGVEDPFGRTAGLEYNSSGQLEKITDMVGIVSEFEYGSGDFVNKLITPYGETSFTSTTVGADRILEITDPKGAKEKVQFSYNASPPDNPVARPDTALIASDITYLAYRNVYYWDKKAYSEGGSDFSKAKLTHYTHTTTPLQMGDFVESEKEPLEERVFFNYPGQSLSNYSGSLRKPSKIGRLLDDGTTQLVQMEYNSMGNVTKAIDPLGRTTTYQYASNGIDLLAVYQQNPEGESTDPFSEDADKLTEITYNSQHLPLTVYDAGRQLTSYTYNSFGQILTITNAKNETTNFTYSDDVDSDSLTDGYLTDIEGPVTGATVHLDYDGMGRLWKMTNSDGDVTELAYDAVGSDPLKTLNRPVKIIFPDTTTSEVTYNLLDVEWTKDRSGRWSRTWVDSLRRPIAQMDPLSRITLFDWCDCGSLEAMTDPAGHRTTWVRDGQSRLLYKFYGNTLAFSNTYDSRSGRLSSITDNAGQKTHFSRNLDNSIQSIAYTNATIPTPTVSYVYDTVYMRPISMTDGTGTTNYAYCPISTTASLGAGQISSIDAPLADDTVEFTYDELGRVLTSSINGSANVTSNVYDTLGRVSNLTNPLGSFDLTYVDQTSRIASMTYPNGQSVEYDYWDATASPAGSGDNSRRLKQIKNIGGGSGPAVLSQFDYHYDTAGRVSWWSQSATSSSGGRYDFQYDAADQLVGAVLKDGTSGLVIKEQYYDYDLAGNRTHDQLNDETTAASYNALNQLTSFGTGSSMTFAGTVSEPSAVTVGGYPAKVETDGTWKAKADVVVGANTIPLTATDQSANTTSTDILVTVPELAARSYSYDANGNVTSDGVRTYEWDAMNRIVAINYVDSDPALRTELIYNGIGNRVAIVEKSEGVATSEKHFVFVGTDIAEERDEDNNITQRFFQQGFQRLFLGDPTLDFYYTRDKLGSIREVTDGTGALRARYKYDHYGARTKVTGVIDIDFGFTGKYQHVSSGLTLFWARVYDPKTSRWLSRDPIGENGGVNLYGYVLNDPGNATDPLGLIYDGGDGFLYTNAGKQLSKNSRWLNPDEEANCHGKTYGDSNYFIDGADVPSILNDEWKPTDGRHAIPGDAVVYGVNPADPTHSAPVTKSDPVNGNPIVGDSHYQTQHGTGKTTGHDEPASNAHNQMIPQPDMPSFKATPIIGFYTPKT